MDSRESTSRESTSTSSSGRRSSRSGSSIGIGSGADDSRSSVSSQGGTTEHEEDGHGNASKRGRMTGQSSMGLVRAPHVVGQQIGQVKGTDGGGGGGATRERGPGKFRRRAPLPRSMVPLGGL